MILIGLAGYKRSGKNTAAKFIREWGEGRNLVVAERAFATLLKVSAIRSLGIYSATSENDCVVLADALKEDGYVSVEIPSMSFSKVMTGREYLKWFGTEGHRDVFGEDFWVDKVIYDHPGCGYTFVEEINYNYGVEADIGVITDVRFANECRTIRNVGGVVWEIDRRNSPDADGHLSEQQLPRDLIDKVIVNHDTLEAFEVNARTMMTAEFHKHFVQPVAEANE